MHNSGDDKQRQGKAWIPLTGSGLALLLLGLVAIAGAGTVMMMM